MMDLKLPKTRKFSNPAPAWKRILSFAVDLLLIQILLSPFSGLLESKIPLATDFGTTYDFFMENPAIINEVYSLVIFVFLLIYAYFVIFEYKLKQTPGKMVFNLYITSTDKKQPITIWKILLRNVSALPVLFFPIYLLWIIDPLYLIVTGNRLLDTITKTKIVEDIEL